jgi:hypothetical protein
MRRVVWNYVNAALMVGITVVLAFTTASWLRRHVSPVAPSWASTGFQVGGAAIILAATIGIAGWEIQTWDGSTMPERVNRFVYRTAYVVGTYFFFLSVAWASP